MSVRAIIFDMDGTLLCTEILCRRAWQQAAGEFGKELADSHYNERLLGRSSADSNALLREIWGTSFEVENCVRRAGDIYRQIIEQEGIALRKGIAELLEMLRNRNFPLAVATSTRRSLALQKLSSTGLIGHFQVVVGGDEVSRGKPDPEIFLLAAQRLGITPEECMAFEDSRAGVCAASAAGMKCILIPDLAPPHIESKKAAWRILESAREAPALLDEIFNGKVKTKDGHKAIRTHPPVSKKVGNSA